MAGRGFYGRLRDKSTPWTDRVKLCRYAWRNRDVTFPNKDQVLLDWLAYALSERQGIEESEAEAVWQCFRDVLRTRKCCGGGEPSRHVTALSLRPNVPLMLIEEIRAIARASEKKPTTSVDVIIDCCHSILTSSTLSYVFTSLPDKMLQLCSSLSQLLNHWSKKLEAEEEVLAILQLLETVLNQNVKTLYRLSNPTQTVAAVCQKLLFHGLIFLDNKEAFENSCLRGKYESCSTIMHSLLNHVFFQKELKSYFEGHLKKKLERQETAVGRQHQFINAIFAIFNKGINGTATEKRAVLHYLPQFYEGFLSFESPQEKCMSFEMLKFLVEHCLDIMVIQVSKVSVLPEWAQSAGSDAYLLSALCGLLDVTSQRDVYDVTDDNDQDLKRLKWLRHLANWLLALQTRCSEWYACLVALMDLNPAIIEPKLTTLLEKTIWQNKGISSCTQSSSTDHFFSSLVMVYKKLSQIPKFVGKLLEVLKLLPDEIQFVPSSLCSSLGAAFTSIAVTSQLSIWELFLREVEEHCRNNLVIDLFCAFLSHVQVADYNLAHQMSQRVSELMTQTWSRCCDAVVKSCVDDVGTLLPSCLRLLYSWAELHLLLRQYAKYTGFQSEDDVTVHISLFIAQVFPVNDSWETLQKIVEKSESAIVSYFKDKLLCQGIKAKLLFELHDQSNIRSQINSVTADLIGEISASCDFEATWSGEPCDVSAENRCVARWATLLDNVYFWGPYLSDDARAVVGRSLVACCLHAGENPEGDLSERSGCVSVAELSRHFLHSEHFCESALLHACVLRAVWSSLYAQLQCKPKSPKKKAKGNRDHILNIFSCLAEPQDSDRKCEELINSQLQEDEWSESALTASMLKTLHRHINLLFLLPLEYLRPEMAEGCLRGLFGVLFLLKTEQEHVTARRLQVIEASFTVMRIVVDGFKPGQLCSGVDWCAALSWLLSFMQGSASRLTPAVVEGYRFIVQKCLKHLIKSPTQSERLESYVTVVKKKIAAIADHESGSKEYLLLAGFQLLQALTKVTRSDDRCGVYYQELSALCVTLIDSATAGQGHSVSPRLLDAYREILFYEKKHEYEGSAAKACLGQTCDKCLEIMANSQVEEELVACLKLLRCVYNNNYLPNTSAEFQDNSLKVTIDTCSKIMQCDNVVNGELTEDFKRRNQTENVQNAALKLLLNDISNMEDANIVSTNQNEALHTSTNQRTDSTEVDESAPQLSVGNGIHKAFKRSEVENELFTTIAVLVGLASDEQFTGILNSMATALVPPMVQKRPSHVISTLKICQVLMTLDLNQSQWSKLGYFIQTAVLEAQGLVTDSCSAMAVKVSVAALDFLTFLLGQGQMFLTPQSIRSCLHACFTSPLDKLACLDDYVTVYQAIYGVVNALLIHHPKVIFSCIPAFVAATKVLLVSVIHRGRQEDTPTAPPIVDKLISCAHCMERIYCQINTHKEDFGKVAVYIIADYVGEVQKVTLLPSVKKALMLGVYHALDLCDQFAVAQLHTVLDAAGRQIFQAIHRDFETYHK